MTSRSLGRVLALSVSVLVAASFAACNSSSDPKPRTSASTSTPPPAASYAAPAAANGEVAAQIAKGQQLYASKCATCHGAAGQGTSQAPAVIGNGALPSNPPANRRLRTGAFRTAKDLGMFIKDNMPMGSTTPPDQTGATLAFLLQSNGITPTQPMSPTSAATIPLNR